MIRAALLVTMLFALNACDKPTAKDAKPAAEDAKPTAEDAKPTAEDVRIGRRAMPISEASLMLRNGYSQKAIVAEVNRRHIPEKISGATEVELTANGAGPDLIAALKDENNLLTRNQKGAYDEWVKGQTTRGLAALQSAESQSYLSEKDRPRLLDLQRQNLRNIEAKEQAERDQASYRSRYEQSRHSSFYIRKQQTSAASVQTERP